MLMPGEGEEPNGRGWTRRGWAKLAIATGAVGSVIALGGTVSGQLLPPPAKFDGDLREEIYYTKWPTEAWWNGRQGHAVEVSDFQEWQGASEVRGGRVVLRRNWSSRRVPFFLVLVSPAPPPATTLRRRAVPPPLIPMSVYV